MLIVLHQEASICKINLYDHSIYVSVFLLTNVFVKSLMNLIDFCGTLRCLMFLFPFFVNKRLGGRLS